MLPYSKLINKAKGLLSEKQGKYRHFSFILYKNSILSFGTNCPTKTSRLAFEFGYEFPYRHSELDAIARFPEPNKFLCRCSMVNIRIGRKDNILVSRPCKDCQKVLKAFNIGEAYFSNEWGRFEKLLF